MHDNEGIIVEFVAAWSQLDPVRLASYFTEDGCTKHAVSADAWSQSH